MKTTRSAAGSADGTDALFLPSFCDIRLVFAVVVLAELLAVVLVLAGASSSGWSRLGLVSLYVQWVALSSAAVLCLARPALARLSDTGAAVVSYLLLVLVAAVVAELAWWALEAGRPWDYPRDASQAGFLLRNVGIAAVIGALALRYFYVRHQWQRQVRAEARARVDALQARIRPHFLFNSLNTVAALTRSRPQQAEEAVQDLADLFRASLGGQDAQVALAQEMDMARRYLHMESLRLGERLQVSWQVDEGVEDLRVPPLILQPLLENAIYHGIEPLPEGGCVQVRGHREPGRLRLQVSNPLPGAGGGRRSGHRLALDNIRQRLALAYGERAGLQARAEGGLYRVELILPAGEAS